MKKLTKRSELNSYIVKCERIIEEAGVILPPFAKWTVDDWKGKGHAYDELRDLCIGWDIWDPIHDWHKMGGGGLTLRNGSQKDPRYPKTYCEKVAVCLEGQLVPWHYHFHRQEDIINRSKRAKMVVELCNHTPDDQLDHESDVMVHKDGRTYTAPAHTRVYLLPGESITINTGTYHSFWTEPGTGDAVYFEVCKVNDDANDNVFLDLPADHERYTQWEEDVPPLYPMAYELPKAKD